MLKGSSTTQIREQHTFVDGTDMSSDHFTPAADYYGCKIKANFSCKLNKVARDVNCTATKIYVYDSGLVLISTGTITGYEASFDIDLTYGYEYYIVVGSDGDGYTQAFQDMPNTPIARHNVNFVEGGYISSGVWNSDSRVFNLITITTTI